MGPSKSFRAAGLVGAIAQLAACAGPIAVGGPGASPLDLGDSGFMLATAGEGPASASASVRAAVEAALVERGFSPKSDARHRVDVALAIAPANVDVAEFDTDSEERIRPTFALCRRQRYVLSIAMFDRRSGRVLFRNRASAVRCDKAAEKVIPALARAVVQGS